jgi:hypothetical protein
MRNLKIILRNFQETVLYFDEFHLWPHSLLLEELAPPLPTWEASTLPRRKQKDLETGKLDSHSGCVGRVGGRTNSIFTYSSSMLKECCVLLRIVGASSL